MTGTDKYYSSQFTQGMKVWQYHQIGAGLMILFGPNLSFKPGFQVIQSFVPCKDNFIASTRNAKRKRWTDKLFFCCDRNCTQSFVTLEELEDHMMKGIHEIHKIWNGFSEKIIFQENDWGSHFT